MQDQHYTDTVFRRWPDGTIDALFPYLADTGYTVTCYSRIGQHSRADYHHVLDQTKPAKPHEYQSLKAELESLGYKIKVIQRANRDKMSQAWRALHTNTMVDYLSLST